MSAPGLPAALARISRVGAGRVDLTLLELIWAINEVTDDEREVVATVVELLRSGRVRLRGNFRGSRFFQT